jgi:hypothetical protein
MSAQTNMSALQRPGEFCHTIARADCSGNLGFGWACMWEESLILRLPGTRRRTET